MGGGTATGGKTVTLPLPEEDEILSRGIRVACSKCDFDYKLTEPTPYSAVLDLLRRHHKDKHPTVVSDYQAYRWMRTLREMIDARDHMVNLWHSRWPNHPAIAAWTIEDKILTGLVEELYTLRKQLLDSPIPTDMWHAIWRAEKAVDAWLYA